MKPLPLPLPLVATCADCDARVVHPTEDEFAEFARTHFRTSFAFDVTYTSVPMREEP